MSEDRMASGSGVKIEPMRYGNCTVCGMVAAGDDCFTCLKKDYERRKEEHKKLRQMAFRALDRVKHLGEDARMQVLDRGMDEWYSQFLKECDPEQLAEIEYHHKVRALLKEGDGAV